MEVLVSTILIMAIFFIGLNIISRNTLKNSISDKLKAELLFFSEYSKNDKIIEVDDTLKFPDFYIINKKRTNVELNTIIIDVEVFTDANQYVSKHQFVMKKE